MAQLGPRQDLAFGAVAFFLEDLRFRAGRSGQCGAPWSRHSSMVRTKVSGRGSRGGMFFSRVSRAIPNIVKESLRKVERSECSG